MKLGLGTFVGAMLLAATACLPIGAQAQSTWPQRSIRIIVPFAPGATSDSVSRRMAQALSARLGQAVYIENRAGAMGMIGMGEAARAKPDGYTFVANDTGFVMLPHLMKSLPYDSARDFVPIAAYVFSPFGVVVNAVAPYKTLKDLIDAAKAQPGRLSYGSGGIGTSPQLAAEAFAAEAGIQLLHVPFKVAGEAITALVTRTIDLQLATPATAMANLHGGRLRMLAVSAEDRLPLLPDVPTFVEAGLPNFHASNWIGLWARKETPGLIVERMQREIQTVMATPEMQDFARGLAAEPTAVVGEAFKRTFEDSDRMWKTVIDQIGLKPQ